jgi:serine/threonine protein kinase
MADEFPTLDELGTVLTATRVVSAARWKRAAARAGGDLTRLLAVLAAEPPEWWSGSEGTTDEPGLTEYQRGVIEIWFEGGPHPAKALALNQFVLLDRLGQGGQGAVFRGRQLNPSRFVAVKVLTQPTDAARARFEQEARAMMKVRHPAVARFYSYERVRDAEGHPTDQYIMAMEFVPGTDLHRMVQARGALPWPFVLHWAVELLRGLVHIHENGFVHRDVKPANIMIAGPPPGSGSKPRDTTAKLLDFGAAKLASADTGAATGTKRVFVGTREYAAPEQWDERIVPESDVYALGGTLFYALTGRPPFQIEGRDAVAYMKAHADAPVPDPREHNRKVPEPLARLVRQMLAKGTTTRGTAAELLAAFQALSESPPAEPKSGYGQAAKSAAKPSAKVPRSDAQYAGGFLGAIEGLFLPAALRPVRGHEPPTGERVTTLLRRPAVLLTIVGFFVALALLVLFLR